MSHPIDLHILRSEDWPEHLLERALASTEGQPVNVHVAPYTGVLGRDRAHGYLQGSAPYVAFLDADDELLAGGLEALLSALESDRSLCGAYGGEEIIHPDGRVEYRQDARWSPVAQLTRSSAMHNGCVMRRSAIMPHLIEIEGYQGRANRLLRGLIVQSGAWQAVQAPVYRWYLREGTLHTMPLPAMDRAVTRRLAPILMAGGVRDLAREAPALSVGYMTSR